jgi:hypothetical protein
MILGDLRKSISQMTPDEALELVLSRRKARRARRSQPKVKENPMKAADGLTKAQARELLRRIEG